MAEALTEVTDQDFQAAVLQADMPVVVDFWAPWCGPCRFVKPVLEKLAADYAGKAKVCSLNVDENVETATRFGITAIPSVLFFQNGRELTDRRLIGARPATEYQRVIDGLLGGGGAPAAR